MNHIVEVWSMGFALYFVVIVNMPDCTTQNDQYDTMWSGSQGSLLNPSPIRTVLVSFPTYGSSLS